MIKILLALSLLTSKVWGQEFQAGMREIYDTKETYSFGSDAAFRVNRNLHDSGYQTLSLQLRLSYLGDSDSSVSLPTVRTPNNELEYISTRVAQGEGKVVFKPMIFDNPGLGVGKLKQDLNPARPDIFFASYQQAVLNYVSVARKKDISEYVFGGGVVQMLDHAKLQNSWNVFFVNLRQRLAQGTKISLELTSEKDWSAFENVMRQNGELAKTLKSLVQKVYFSVDNPSSIYNYDMTLNLEMLDQFVERSSRTVQKYLGAKPMGLSQISIPGCTSWNNVGTEVTCLDSTPNFEKQEKNLVALRKWVSTKAKSYSVESVELMEALTDFEPANPDLRYLYFNKKLRSPEFKSFNTVAGVVLPSLPLSIDSRLKTACVLYDKYDLPGYVDLVGQIHATMLESLLGAFPTYNVKKLKVQDYKKGELNSCSVAFYLSTNFAYKLTNDFIDDVSKFVQNHQFVWTNYKFNAFAERYNKQNSEPLSFDVPYMLQADSIPSATNEDPGFFKYFEYKGETFFKLSKWDPTNNKFAANPELGYVQIKDNQNVKVHSWAVHSKTSEKRVPYAVESKTKNGKLWYFADSPLSYVHNEDRFYILCDLLWDILEVKAPTDHIALVRIEDVSPGKKLKDLTWAVNYLSDNKVPFAYALIPLYNDLEGTGGFTNRPMLEPLTKFPEMVGHIKYAMNRGGDIVMHGVEHALGEKISGYDGVTGDDYEFWLYPENRPVPKDSVDWVLSRLERGEKVFKDLGIKTDVWELPHYAASALDYLIFGKIFTWNWHRTVYFPFEIKKDTGLTEDLKFFKCDTPECRATRRGVLRNINVETNYATFGGMNSPFTIYKDAYGQALIPESLGSIDFAFFSKNTWRPVSTPEDIVRRAKKLKVIRGSVASFFWHSDLLSPALRYFQENPGSFEEMGGVKSLQTIVDGIKGLGYKFVSVKDCKYFPRKDCRI